MKLAEGLHLVGSGRLGFSMTHSLDCHAYLMATDRTAVLIDAGCGLGQDSILAGIDKSGVPRELISTIFLTHAHADHSGGAAGLADALRARVVASQEVAAMLAGPDEDAIGLRAARLAGTYPADFTISGVQVGSVASGRMAVGDLVVEAIDTPGHARGHVAYVVELGHTRFLFSGDLVFARGRVVVLGSGDSDVQALERSIGRVAELRPDSLLPGHGEVVMRDADAHVGAALDCFQRGQIPPSLL